MSTNENGKIVVNSRTVDENKRIEWIDTAKGIGLLLVMIGHLHVPYITTWIYFFHMPLFFFLSGVVFSEQKYNFKDFLIRRVKSLVIPYFSLGIVIWCFYVIINAIIGAENSLYGSNVSMLKDLMIQEHFWTIWFLAALFITELIYYWINRLFVKNVLLMSVVSVVICIIGLVRYRLGYGSLLWNIDIALVAQLFFHAGWMFKKCNKFSSYILCDNRGRTVLLAICLLCVNMVSGAVGIKIAHESLDMSVGLYGNEVLTMISAFSGILFIVVISNYIHSRVLTYLGKNTMILFAWHSRIVIVLCGYIYSAIGVFQGDGLCERLLYGVITLIIILVVLIPINEVIKKSKIHTIFGV
jgi:fucose 4-O-acetylase-like acetyltransferase